MATKITLTDDVGIVSTASNASGSIKWHVYERTVVGVTGIYVQRESPPNTLIPEVLFVPNGKKPRISFDIVSLKWLLLYDFNEQTWLLEIDETDAPTIRPSQAGTLIVHMRLGAAEHKGDSTVEQDRSALIDADPFPNAYVAPVIQAGVGVAASPTPGFFRIRWIPFSNPALVDYNNTIVGFNVYRHRHDNGQVERVNPSMVPFEGFDIHEFELVGHPGTYMVTQLERTGIGSSRILEGRIGNPKDSVLSNGQYFPDIIQSVMDPKIDEARPSPDLQFVVTGFTILNFVLSDTYPSHGPGEGFLPTAAITADYDLINLGTVAETFPSHGPGEGFVSRLTRTGFDVIVVG